MNDCRDAFKCQKHCPDCDVDESESDEVLEGLTKRMSKVKSATSEKDTSVDPDSRLAAATKVYRKCVKKGKKCHEELRKLKLLKSNGQEDKLKSLADKKKDAVDRYNSCLRENKKCSEELRLVEAVTTNSRRFERKKQRAMNRLGDDEEEVTLNTLSKPQTRRISKRLNLVYRRYEHCMSLQKKCSDEWRQVEEAQTKHWRFFEMKKLRALRRVQLIIAQARGQEKRDSRSFSEEKREIVGRYNSCLRENKKCSEQLRNLEAATTTHFKRFYDKKERSIRRIRQYVELGQEDLTEDMKQYMRNTPTKRIEPSRYRAVVRRYESCMRQNKKCGDELRQVEEVQTRHWRAFESKKRDSVLKLHDMVEEWEGETSEESDHQQMMEHPETD